MPDLGVNIDHVATVRNARGTNEPDPVTAAALAQLAGADGITIHLREDRRHITDRDLRLLGETVTCKLNLEMSIADEIVAIAIDAQPPQATLVPEKREEVTTEGGLDVVGNHARVADAVHRLQDAGIAVSLFIDPERPQIEAARDLGCEAIELHTGTYADAASGAARNAELLALTDATEYGLAQGLVVNAGHGLTYHNVRPIAQIEGMHELNIGHSIISRAVLVGLERAVREMRALVAG